MARFGDECQRWLDHHPCSDRTRDVYQSALDAHVRPVLGDRSLTAVAAARDDVADLLTGRLKDSSASLRKRVRLVITGTLDEAVRAGKIPLHRCEGLHLAEDGPGDHDDFVFPSHGQLTKLAAALRLPLAVWLMRGCGLRISEAMAVRKSCFRDGGKTLRVFEQALTDGSGTAPLKGRKKGEYRDIPVPAYLREKVKDLPDGYFFMTGGASFAEGGRLPRYSAFKQSFDIHKKKMKIPKEFTPHSLRHAFASALLARNVPITDLAKWLGHKNINVTYAVYGHLVPSSLVRAVSVLDEEYAEWSEAA
jgi:integrase